MARLSNQRRKVARRIRRRLARYVALSAIGYTLAIAALYVDSSTGAMGYYVFGGAFLGMWSLAFYHDFRAQRHFQRGGYAHKGRFGYSYWRRPWALKARIDDPPSAIVFHQRCLRTIAVCNIWGFLATLVLLVERASTG